MNMRFISAIPLPEFRLWRKLRKKRRVISFDLEITARCNNNCRHCYINLPAADKEAMQEELSFARIKKIVDEAVSLGALWCLITGGEPLLRRDFFEIYLYLKKKGLLVTIFTNATLITEKHIELFKKYPPRDIEITVYGVTKETYARVTRAPNTFAAFRRGFNLLLRNGVKFRLKIIALRSNLQEFSKIAQFCRKASKNGYFRVTPYLHLRFDGNQKRNAEIKSERLSPQEIAALEQNDPKRFLALKKECAKLNDVNLSNLNPCYLFSCGAGQGNFVLSYDGFFRLCSSLWHPDCIYDLKRGGLRDAWNNLVPKVRGMQSKRKYFLDNCARCKLTDWCMWCPAHAYLEKGQLDTPVGYFCEATHLKKRSLKDKFLSL